MFRIRRGCFSDLTYATVVRYGPTAEATHLDWHELRFRATSYDLAESTGGTHGFFAPVDRNRGRPSSSLLGAGPAPLTWAPHSPHAGGAM